MGFKSPIDRQRTHTSNGLGPNVPSDFDEPRTVRTPTCTVVQSAARRGMPPEMMQKVEEANPGRLSGADLKAEGARILEEDEDTLSSRYNDWLEEKALDELEDCGPEHVDV